MADVLERLASARSAVEQSCHLLLDPTPEILDQCAGVFSLAIGELAASRDSIAPLRGNSAVLTEMRAIQAKLHLASRLLKSAAAYHDGWHRILGSMLAGYTAGGGVATVSRPGRLMVEG